MNKKTWLLTLVPAIYSPITIIYKLQKFKFNFKIHSCWILSPDGSTFSSHWLTLPRKLSNCRNWRGWPRYPRIKRRFGGGLFHGGVWWMGGGIWRLVVALYFYTDLVGAGDGTTNTRRFAQVLGKLNQYNTIKIESLNQITNPLIVLIATQV